MDLLRCDGAALYYQGKYYPLGVTPTEAQIKDIVEWLLACHGDSTCISTDKQRQPEIQTRNLEVTRVACSGS
ncbi:hypothetical protein RND71_014639 [Anisodus tanguticus]|uniref:Phytochrome central region domain-containing protein n=1 Tax=Anisodus tanguticus TaxID=243964 RepID=A0AAE1VMX7_9SOLA|nr:hypothetical protein RND71_014639 [Anisodus tanguticus]